MLKKKILLFTSLEIVSNLLPCSHAGAHSKIIIQFNNTNILQLNILWQLVRPWELILWERFCWKIIHQVQVPTEFHATSQCGKSVQMSRTVCCLVIRINAYANCIPRLDSSRLCGQYVTSMLQFYSTRV